MNLDAIKEALSKATPDWYDNGNEIVSNQNMRVGIGGFLKEEDNVLAAHAPEWLASLVSEVERLNKRLEASVYIGDHNYDLAEERGRKVEEMQKTLEWYADELNWGTIEEYGAFVSDGGELARETLKRLRGESV